MQAARTGRYARQLYGLAARETVFVGQRHDVGPQVDQRLVDVGSQSIVALPVPRPPSALTFPRR